MPEAHVVLIGGGSSVGKTTVARSLSERLGVELGTTDLGPGDDPRIDPLAGPLEIWDRPAEDLCRLLITAAEVANPFIEQQVLARRAGAVIEGERVHPALIRRMVTSGLARGVLIIETDAHRLHRTLLGRSRGFVELTEARQRNVAEVDRLYGHWLSSEACRLDLPWVPSQPWNTLLVRVVAATH